MKTIRKLSDRLLTLVAPKIEADAAGACLTDEWCAWCDPPYQGSQPIKQKCHIYAVCRVECSPCLVNFC
jgi:hypothetical protein